MARIPEGTVEEFNELKKKYPDKRMLIFIHLEDKGKYITFERDALRVIKVVRTPKKSSIYGTSTEFEEEYFTDYALKLCNADYRVAVFEKSTGKAVEVKRDVSKPTKKELDYYNSIKK